MSNTISFQIVSSELPKLTLTSYNTDGTKNFSLNFRLIFTTDIPQIDIDNIITDIKIYESKTGYDFYTGYNRNNIDARKLSDIFKYEPTKNYYYVDLVHNYVSDSNERYTEFIYKVSYSYDILNSLKQKNTELAFDELIECFLRKSETTVSLTIQNVNTVISDLPIPITSDTSVKNIEIVYATEQERLLKNKVLQDKLTQEQLSKFFSGMYYTRDFHSQRVYGYFIFNKLPFINQLVPTKLTNFFNSSTVDLKISAKVKCLDESNTVLNELTRDLGISPISNSSAVYKVDDLIDYSNLLSSNLKSVVEVDLNFKTNIQQVILSDYNFINRLLVKSELINDFISTNYDSNFDVYNQPTSSFLNSFKPILDEFRNQQTISQFKDILTRYFSITAETFIVNILKLTGFKVSVNTVTVNRITRNIISIRNEFDSSTRPEDIQKFIKVIKLISSEIKRFRDSFDDFNYSYTYRFKNEYNHDVPINTGLLVFNKQFIGKNYEEEKQKISNYTSLFKNYYDSPIELEDGNIFLTARNFYINSKSLKWDRFVTAEDFLNYELIIKTQLTKNKRQDYGLYSDTTQPFSKASILVFSNDQISSELLYVLNKSSKYRLTKETGLTNILFDSTPASEIKTYNIKSVNDNSLKSFFESYVELFFPTFIIEYYEEQTGTWQTVEVTGQDTSINISPNTGFFRIRRMSDERFNYNFSPDVRYPLYDEYFDLPFTYFTKYPVNEDDEIFDTPLFSLPEVSTVRVPPPKVQIELGQNTNLGVLQPQPPQLNFQKNADVPLDSVPQNPVAAPPPEQQEPVVFQPPQNTINTEQPPAPEAPQAEFPVPNKCSLRISDAYIVLRKGEYLFYNTQEEYKKELSASDITGISAITIGINLPSDTSVYTTELLKDAYNCVDIRQKPSPLPYPSVSSCNTAGSDAYIVLTQDGRYLYFASEADYKAALMPEQIKSIKGVIIGENILLQNPTTYTQQQLIDAFECKVIQKDTQSTITLPPTKQEPVYTIQSCSGIDVTTKVYVVQTSSGLYDGWFSSIDAAKAKYPDGNITIKQVDAKYSNTIVNPTILAAAYSCTVPPSSGIKLPAGTSFGV